MKTLEPGPRTEELRDFYDLSYRVVELNTAVVEGVLAHPSAARVLSTGRLVMLSDAVSSNNRIDVNSANDELSVCSISAIALPSFSSLHHSESLLLESSTIRSDSLFSRSFHQRFDQDQEMLLSMLSLPGGRLVSKTSTMRS